MTSVEKRRSGRKSGGHRKHSDGGYSDTSSGGSFLDETDREVSNLTDRAFRSLCIGDEAVYNDSDLCSSSPCAQRDRQLAFNESGQNRDGRERENPKSASHESFTLRMQQYGQDMIHGGMYGAEIQRDPQWEVYGEKTKGRVSASFQQSFVETSQQRETLGQEQVSLLSNGATELNSQQRRSRSRVSSLIRAFNSEGQRDGEVADGKPREWNDETSWDKSALMSIQRELTEFSTPYQQNVHSGQFPSYDTFASQDTNLYSSKVSDMNSASSFMSSSHSNHSMSAQVNCNSNFFIHSEFSPFKVWRDYNRFPFSQGGVSGFMHCSEFPKWYETPMYKELSLEAQPQGPYQFGERVIRDQRNNLAPVVPPTHQRSTSTSTMMQKAPAVEKRCESELTGHYPHRKRTQSLGTTKLPPQRPSTASPSSDMSRRVQDTISSVKALQQKIKMMTEQNCITGMTTNQPGGLCSNDNSIIFNNNAESMAPNVTSGTTRTTPFNISHLLTPLVYAHQEAETSEVGQNADSPQPVEHAPVRAESRGATPDIRMSSYRSRASSLLFNLKDNRKRVKSTYSPTKFKGLETFEKNIEPSTQEPRDTVIDIPDFPDPDIQFLQVEESTRTNAASDQYANNYHSPGLTLSKLNSQPEHIGQIASNYQTAQMQSEMVQHSGFTDLKPQNLPANGQNLYEELSFTPYKEGGIDNVESPGGDVYKFKQSYTATETPRVNADNFQHRGNAISKANAEQHLNQTVEREFTKVDRYQQLKDKQYDDSNVSSHDKWIMTNSRDTDNLKAISPWKQEITALMEKDQHAQASQRAAIIKEELNSPKDKYRQNQQSVNKEFEKRNAPLSNDSIENPAYYGQHLGAFKDKYALQKYYGHNDGNEPKDDYLTQNNDRYADQQYKNQHTLNFNKDISTPMQETAQRKQYMPNLKVYELQSQQPIETKSQLEPNRQKCSLSNPGNAFAPTMANQVKDRYVIEIRPEQIRAEDIKAQHNQAELAKAQHWAQLDQPKGEPARLILAGQIGLEKGKAEQAKAELTEHKRVNQVKPKHMKTEEQIEEKSRQNLPECARDEQTKSEQTKLQKNDQVKVKQAEAERLKEENIKAELAKAEQARQARLEQAKAEQARRGKIEAEHIAEEKAKADQFEKGRMEAERIRTERVQAEQAEAERIKAEKAKLEQIQKQSAKAQIAKLEQLQAQQAKAEQAKLEQLQQQQAKAEQAKLEQIKERQAKAEQAKLEQIQEQQAKEQQAKLEQLKEQQAKEEQAKLEQLQEQQAKEQQAKEQQAKELQAKLEQLQEQQAKEQQAKELQAKLEQLQEQQAKELQAKEQQAKEQQAKLEQIQEQQAKEQQAKLEQIQEQQAKEQQAKEQQAKLEQIQEQQAKEQQAKEQQAKLEQLKEQQAKEEQAKLEQLRELQAKEEQAKLKQIEGQKDKAKQAEIMQIQAQQTKAEQAEPEHIQEQQAKTELGKLEQIKEKQVQFDQNNTKVVKMENALINYVQVEDVKQKTVLKDSIHASRESAEQPSTQISKAKDIKAEQAKLELTKVELAKEDNMHERSPVTQQVKREPDRVELVKTELAKAKAELAKIKEKMRGEQKEKVRNTVLTKENGSKTDDCLKININKNADQQQSTQMHQQRDDSVLSKQYVDQVNSGPNEYLRLREKYGFIDTTSPTSNNVLAAGNVSSNDADEIPVVSLNEVETKNKSSPTSRVATDNTQNEEEAGSLKPKELTDSQYVYSESSKEFKLSGGNYLPFNEDETAITDNVTDQVKDDSLEKSKKSDPLKHTDISEQRDSHPPKLFPFERNEGSDKGSHFTPPRALSSKERAQTKQEILTSRIKAHAEKEISAIKEKGFAVREGFMSKHPARQLSGSQSMIIRQRPPAQEMSKKHEISSNHTLKHQMEPSEIQMDPVKSFSPPSSASIPVNSAAISSKLLYHEELIKSNVNGPKTSKNIKDRSYNMSANEGLVENLKKENQTGIKSPIQSKEQTPKNKREKQDADQGKSSRQKEGLKDNVDVKTEHLNKKKEEPSIAIAAVESEKSKPMTTEETEIKHEAGHEDSAPSLNTVFGQNETLVADESLKITGIMVSVRERKQSMDKGQSNMSTLEQMNRKDCNNSEIDKCNSSSGLEASKGNTSSMELSMVRPKVEVVRNTHSTKKEDQTNVGMNNRHENRQETSTLEARMKNVSETVTEKNTNLQQESSTIIVKSLVKKGAPSTVTELAKNKVLAESQPLLYKQDIMANKIKDQTKETARENSAKSLRLDKVKISTEQNDRPTTHTNNNSKPEVIENTNGADAETLIKHDIQPSVKEDMSTVRNPPKSRKIDGNSAPLVEENMCDSTPPKPFIKISPSINLTENENTHVSPKRQYEETHMDKNNQEDDNVNIGSIAIRVVPAVTEKVNLKMVGKHSVTTIPSDVLALDEFKQDGQSSLGEKVNTLNTEDRSKVLAPANSEKQTQDSLEEKLAVQSVLSSVKRLSDSLKISNQENSINTTIENTEKGQPQRVNMRETVDDLKKQPTVGDYFQVQGVSETNDDTQNCTNVEVTSDAVSKEKELPGLLPNTAAISNKSCNEEKHVVDQSERKTVETISAKVQDDNMKRKNGKTEDNLASKQSDGPTEKQSNSPTEKQSNTNEKTEASQAIHIRKRQTVKQPSLSARERQSSRKTHPTYEDTDKEKPQVKPKPKERVSTIPEISALADYARLKVIVSEDEANPIQEFPPNKKEGFFPIIQTRHSRRPVFTADPQVLPVKQKSLPKKTEVNSKLNKEPKPVVFPITEKEHQRTGMFKLGDKERQDKMKMDAKANKGILDGDSKQAQHLKETSKSPTKYLSNQRSEKQVAGTDNQRVCQEAQSIHQPNNPPSLSTTSVNRLRSNSASQHLKTMDSSNPPEHVVGEGCSVEDTTATPRKDGKIENALANIGEDKRRQKMLATRHEEIEAQPRSRAKQFEEKEASRIEEGKRAEEMRVQQMIEENRASLAQEERRAAQREEERRIREREAISAKIKERRGKQRAAERRAEEEKASQEKEATRAKQIEEERRIKEIEEKRRTKVEEERRATLRKEEELLKENEEKRRRQQEEKAVQEEQQRRATLEEKEKADQKIEEQMRERRKREDWMRTQREEDEKRAVEKALIKQREERRAKEEMSRLIEESQAAIKEEGKRVARERMQTQREEEIRAQRREEKDHTFTDHRETERAEKQKRATAKMDSLQYYAITSADSEKKPRERQLCSPSPSQQRQHPSGLGSAEDSGSYTRSYRPQAAASPALSLPRSNSSSPALGVKPSMFRVKDNTFRGSSLTKSVKPRLHKSFGEDFRVGSPLERGDEEQEIMRRSAGTPDTGLNRLAAIKESSTYPYSSQDYSAHLSQHRPYSRRSIVLDEDDSRSVISNMSEDGESCATSAADLADLRGLYDYERPESACSYSSDMSRSTGKPPTVPPKSEKALRRAKRLTTRRIKKDISKTVADSPVGVEKSLQEDANSPSSIEVCSNIRRAVASPHFSSPVSLAHAPAAGSGLASLHSKHQSSHSYASPHATGPISLAVASPHATAPVSIPVAPPNAAGPASHTSALKTVAHVSSSPILHHAKHPAPAPVTQYHVESSYPHSYPMTQRKVLQDLGSGQYFVVDVPVQVKTKTFFDPETGKYVQLNVRESGQSTSRAPPQQMYTQPQLQPHMQVKVQQQSQVSPAGKPFGVYQGNHGYPKDYQAPSINSVPSHSLSAPVTVHQNQQSVRQSHSYGHTAPEMGQNSDGHCYSPEKTPYMDTVNDKGKTYNTVYNTHGPYESFPEFDTNSQLAGSPVCENDNSAHSQSQPRDIISISELDDFMEMSDW
ncbi:cardiac-enriched FHL2-interacting protein isoform X3 [Notothenia coriiceps]|uniref:Microtubule-associated protein futsch-like isoform X2 n=1 Tax=Notothenia coriiceps TaxID=8208 RepID=A0A6I9PVD1_9TELE|nr:PREDICTED: microtubule-associated protein futsch-like isoform X2 [Notothenia coriiceps]XP_010789257.1 PREDICTED: microtubule-associated protein futsch-like isoform X3 [Notothenia coriiceps]